MLLLHAPHGAPRRRQVNDRMPPKFQETPQSYNKMELTLEKDTVLPRFLVTLRVCMHTYAVMLVRKEAVSPVLGFAAAADPP